MKELSIEEKAKAYDEAIKYAHYLINERCKEGTNGSFHRADLDKMFPELKESEDERIRKELLNYLYDVHDDDEERARWIAYLEKQGEHANFLSKIQVGDKVTRNEDGVLVNLSQLNRVAKKDEKQGEQKPMMIQWEGNNLKEVIDFTGKDKNFDKWFKSFEEYEKYVHAHDNIFKIFNEDGSHYEVPVGAWIIKTPDGCNVASKSIFVQKPAWSEEDELIIDKILCICNDFERSFENSPSSIKIIKEDVDKIDFWLKSLKDKYTWKPSEFQLGGLSDAIIRYEARGINAVALKELFEQLKKLREE